MNINQEKQLENRLQRLSNPTTIKKNSLTSSLTLALVLLGSVSLLAFQYVQNRKPILSISSDKMNTIYIGIENPMTVAVEGIENKGVQVTSDEVEIRPNGYGQYIVTATKEGQATIKVVTNSFEKEMLFNVEKVPSTKVNFEKPLKDPYSVTMTVEEFKALKEFKTEFNEQLGFDCKIVRFNLKRWVYGVDESVEIFNAVIDENPSFVRKFMNTAKKGDYFSLREIQAVCPGDDEARELSSMSIKLK